MPLAESLRLLVASRGLLGACVAVAVAGSAVLFLARGTDYLSVSQFVPQSPAANASRLAGLAAQIGVAIPGMGGSAGDSPQFYVSLLRSRRLLADLLTRPLPLDTTGTPPTVSLLDSYDLSELPEPARTQKGIRRLQRKISVSVDLKTGIVTIVTSAKRPDQAVAMNRQLLGLVQEFNLERRRTQATDERRFVEQRLLSARDELLDAERSVTGFLERNRAYQGSPPLVAEYQRLLRAVEQKQQVVIGLAQAFEQSRIEEVRNTPLISIVDPPTLLEDTTLKDLVTQALLAAVLGLLIGLVIVLGRERLASWRQHGAAEPAEA